MHSITTCSCSAGVSTSHIDCQFKLAMRISVVDADYTTTSSTFYAAATSVAIQLFMKMAETSAGS